LGSLSHVGSEPGDYKHHRGGELFLYRRFQREKNAEQYPLLRMAGRTGREGDDLLIRSQASRCHDERPTISGVLGQIQDDRVWRDGWLSAMRGKRRDEDFLQNLIKFSLTNCF
jgi:hypothetical protein